MNSSTQTSPGACIREIPGEEPATLSAVPPHRPWYSRSVLSWLKNMAFIAMNLSCLAVFFVSPTWLSLALCEVLLFARMFGITAGYHRYFAHHSFKTSRWFQFALACLGCSSMQKGPLWWVSHHREHHRDTDKPGDPHSPIVKSFWWAHIGWILDGAHDETCWPAVRDWSSYPELRWLDRLQWIPGILLAGTCWLIDGWSGLVWGFCLSTVLLFHTTFAVNSICHVWGSRRYETPDGSRNNAFVALLTMGEGWHNNHHHYQSSARQGFFWWEIDVSYYLIRLLGLAGLVWDIRQPGTHVVAATVGTTKVPSHPACEPIGSRD